MADQNAADLTSVPQGGGALVGRGETFQPELRRGNAPTWSSLCGISSLGTWTLILVATGGALLDHSTIPDVLLVVGCAARARARSA